MNISIITVCKNSEKTIERSMISVFTQIYKNIEYIVIDGNSSDRTIEILEKYKNSITRLVSEKDHGIYNAMNKALTLCGGDIVYFLNSDDYLYDKYVIQDVVSEFRKSDKIGILYGNVMMTDGIKRRLVKYPMIDKKYFYKNTICHQALFVKADLFQKIGKFDESFKIHADTDWLLKAFYKRRINFRYFDRNICYFSTLGICSNPIYAEKYKLDRQRISAKYFIEARIKLIIKILILFCINKIKK